MKQRCHSHESSSAVYVMSKQFARSAGTRATRGKVQYMSAEDAEALGAETERVDALDAHFHEELVEALESLNGLEGQGEYPDQLVRALRVALTASNSAMGQCQIDVPFAPLHPVITKGGQFRWCCSHPTQHCVNA